MFSFAFFYEWEKFPKKMRKHDNATKYLILSRHSSAFSIVIFSMIEYCSVMKYFAVCSDNKNVE